MTYGSSLYNNLLGGYPPDPMGGDGSGAGAFDPTDGGLSGGLGGMASPSLGAGDLGASSAVSQALVPLATSVLSAPAGTLTKDRLVGDTANFLSSARASGALSDDHFGHVVRGAIDFLTPFDDDTPDPVLRAATGRMLVNHLVAHGQVQALAGGGGDGAPQPAQGSGPQPTSAAPAAGSDLSTLFANKPYSSNPWLKGVDPLGGQVGQDPTGFKAQFRQHPNTLPGTPETLWPSDPGYRFPPGPAAGASAAVTPQSIDEYLRSKYSQMVGQGEKIYNIAKEFNVDPRLLVSLAGAETGFGKAITRGKYNVFNWLWNRDSPKDSDFDNWDHAIRSVARGISKSAPNPRNAYDMSSTERLYVNSPNSNKNYCSGPGCRAALANVNKFMIEQGADPNSLYFPKD